MMETYVTLYHFCSERLEELAQEFKEMSHDTEKEGFSDELEAFAQKLRGLSDHALHHIEDLRPAPPEEPPFEITEELMKEAFRAGRQAMDFSIEFLQQHFMLGYDEAGRLQLALIREGKIAPMFLAGETLCEG